MGLFYTSVQGVRDKIAKFWCQKSSTNIRLCRLMCWLCRTQERDSAHARSQFRSTSDQPKQRHSVQFQAQDCSRQRPPSRGRRRQLVSNVLRQQGQKETTGLKHQFIEVGNCKEKTIILSQYTTIGFSPACSSCRTRMVRKYWETSRSISTLCDDAPCPSKCHQSDSISGQVYERMVFKGAAESPNCLVVTVMPKAWHWPYLPYFPHQPLD